MSGDQTVIEQVVGLWLEGQDRVAIVGALLETMPGGPDPDTVIAVLAPALGHAEVTAAVTAAMAVIRGGQSPE